MQLQLRSKRLTSAQTKALLGKRASLDDFPVMLTGDAAVFKPDGKRLLVVRRGAISESSIDAAFPFMYALRAHVTNNRGNYAGVDRETSDGREKVGSLNSTRYRAVKKDGTVSNTTHAPTVRSAVVGYFDRYPRIPFCRETVLSTRYPEEWKAALPFIREIGDLFKETVPDRYAAQLAAANGTHPAYILPGTPFTTVTVNNTVAGAYHTDKGDYAPGFGVMAVFRKGKYRGANLGFPEYGVGADLHHGDVIFFDSHEVHGNVPFFDTEGEEGKDFIRISMVFYYREKMKECLAPVQELERAKKLRGNIEINDDEAAGLAE